MRPVAKLDHLHTPGEGSHQAAVGAGGEGHVGYLQHSAPDTRGGYSHGAEYGGGKITNSRRDEIDEKRVFLVIALSFCFNCIML